MSAVMRITEAELLEALAAVAGDVPEEARTVTDMHVETGVSIQRIREGLRKLDRDGRLVMHRVCRRAIDGRMAVVAAYTITPVTPPKPEKRAKRHA